MQEMTCSSRRRRRLNPVALVENPPDPVGLGEGGGHLRDQGGRASCAVAGVASRASQVGWWSLRVNALSVIWASCGGVWLPASG
jgi:hypothetical protein